MFVAAFVATALISEPVRLRGRVRYYVRRERTYAPANRCTDATPEHCGDEPPIRIHRTRVDGDTFEDRFTFNKTKTTTELKGDRK